jgi:hypothetical protein
MLSPKEPEKVSLSPSPPGEESAEEAEWERECPFFSSVGVSYTW